jgi:hypothetical protein
LATEEDIPVKAFHSKGLAYFVFASLLCWASSSAGYLAMPNEPIAHKVAAADAVVLGKITAIEDRPVQGQVYRYAPAYKMPFTVVEVEPQESLYGPKDRKRVRFGFRDTQAYRPALAVGQTGYFCGVQVGRNDFSIVPIQCFCEQNDPGFAKDLASARRLGRLLGEPEKGLNARDEDDRLLTAYLLILRHCYAPWRRGETGKTEPIDAEQSQRILLELAGGDWAKHRLEVRDAVAALQLAVKFGAPMLKDFPPDRADEEWPAATRRWLRENAASYRIHRLLKSNPQKDKGG